MRDWYLLEERGGFWEGVGVKLILEASEGLLRAFIGFFGWFWMVGWYFGIGFLGCLGLKFHDVLNPFEGTFVVMLWVFDFLEIGFDLRGLIVSNNFTSWLYNFVLRFLV